MAPTAAAPKSSAPYWLTLPDWMGWRRVASLAGDHARCVDRAVDHALVDVAVDPVAGALAVPADAVDDAVDDVSG